MYDQDRGGWTCATCGGFFRGPDHCFHENEGDDPDVYMFITDGQPVDTDDRCLCVSCAASNPDLVVGDQCKECRKALAEILRSEEA